MGPSRAGFKAPRTPVVILGFVIGVWYFVSLPGSVPSLMEIQPLAPIWHACLFSELSPQPLSHWFYLHLSDF